VPAAGRVSKLAHLSIYLDPQYYAEAKDDKLNVAQLLSQLQIQFGRGILFTRFRIFALWRMEQMK